MLLKIYLSVLFFATVIPKIEEKRFVLWGIVPQTENLSVVLDITMSKDSNAVLLCGTECNAQNNCSGMDICEEIDRCRIWETSFVENFNSTDTAVKTCRRYMKVDASEIEQNKLSTMKTSDIAPTNITTHKIGSETTYSSFDIISTDKTTSSESSTNSTVTIIPSTHSSADGELKTTDPVSTEPSHLLETTTTYEPATETSSQGTTTTTDQSPHGISSQTGSTFDPHKSESLRPETTITNTQVIETLSHDATATTDLQPKDMSTPIGSVTTDLQETETISLVEPISTNTASTETTSLFDSTSSDVPLSDTTTRNVGTTTTDLLATDISTTAVQLSTGSSSSLDLTTTDLHTTELSTKNDWTTIDHSTTKISSIIDLTTTEPPTTEISSINDLAITDPLTTPTTNHVDSTTPGLQTSIIIHSTSQDPATTEQTSYSPASTDISVIESSFATRSTVAYPSSEQTTTGRSDLTCVFTYEFSGGKLHEVPCFNDSYSWIIIQRRYDGSTSFYRNWADYENGFGSVTSEIWLGNQYIHELTTVGYNILRIELTSFAGEVTQIEYDFSIDDKASNYRLHISERGVSGLNSLETSDLALFCTYDKDNDNIRTTNCAELSEHASGWWHSKAAWCTDGNLNGIYTNEYKNYQQGVYWFAWDKQWTLKETKMMLRKL